MDHSSSSDPHDPSAWPDPALLDVAGALERMDQDRGFLLEIYRLFARDAARRRESLVRSLESGDLDQTAKAAHSLKGMSGTVVSPRLQEFSLAVETAAKEGEENRLSEMLPDYLDLVDRVLSAVAEQIGRLESGPQAQPDS
jgi:protein-histidine pros-kinase